MIEELSARRIETLEPSTQDLARRLLEKAEAEGIKLRVVQALRTGREQNALYIQGRMNLEDVNKARWAVGWPPLKDYENKKVTNAKARQSWHNFGRAFDVVPMNDGVPDWNSMHWEHIGDLGEELGLEWGGRWQKPDRPHFQYTQGMRLEDAAV